MKAAEKLALNLEGAATLVENVQEEVGNSAVTSGKGIVNGTATSAVAFVTIGIYDDEWQVIPVTQEDLRRGYYLSFGATRIWQEVNVGLATGGASRIMKGGQVVTLIAKGAFLYDAAGNVVGVAKNGGQIVTNGPTVTNVVGLGASLAGLSGNLVSKSDAFNRLLPHTAKGTGQLDEIDNVADHVAPTALSHNAPLSGKHWTDFADEAARIRENAARSRGLDPNQRVLNMAIPRKKVLEKIAGYRKGIPPRRSHSQTDWTG
jgi:hypothetical protein